ncbi:hypothetical protein PR002_g17002 [Phytophthora rubi]|uniref:Tc1-like transposase DDE domain-containing protein n=1 Tax=Phytophthora rubi TaxID=129364 RepID=A0A6A3KGI5_9STRA|nr:hypothetical protein PR002_g17002 [Phytophthora rubi]
MEKAPAKRSSRRRPAGTLETKEVSVTKATYHDMLISRVLPSIEARWPNTSGAVVIQQDNAPARIKPDDPQFTEAAACCGRHVELRFQPANSPDLNALDLGLFCAIQARQRKTIARTLDELIEAITESYWELPARTINAAFISLQDSMDQCIKQRGDNAYKPRHMKKAKLEREGRLPLSIRCSDEAAVYLAEPAIL